MAFRRTRLLLSLTFVFALSDAIVSQAGVTFATHGHNDFSAFGGDADLMSTEAYLVPNIADTISNRVGGNETAVIEVSGTRNGGEWAFEETLRTPVHPGDSPAIHELVVLMNWESAANGSVSAQEVGDAFAGFVLKNRPEWISRFGSIAVTGHSRGATFVDGFTSSLGKSNVLVDSVAYLDAVPNSDFGDVTPTHRENVVFAQSVKQEGLFTGLNLSGATNIDITGLLSGLPGFPQVDLGDDPHFAVLAAFGDTIDQTRTSSLPYGGTNPERNGFGGEYFHFGDLAHDRPLDGLHPTAGGEAATSGVTFGEDELWPAITMTQESRARLLLMSDDKRIDVIYRDPDLCCSAKGFQSYFA